jgi:hypothetical protein
VGIGLTIVRCHGAKIAAGVILACGLAGCSDGSAQFAAASGNTSSAQCHDVATERASDAQVADFDDETQRQVFSRTYAECTAWYEKEDAAWPPSGGSRSDRE